MERLVIQYGIPGLIKLIIAACRKKHEHYAPTVSTFSAWADVLEAHLPQMQQEATRIHSPHESA